MCAILHINQSEEISRQQVCSDWLICGINTSPNNLLNKYSFKVEPVPYKNDLGPRRKFWKAPLRGSQILFCGRRLRFSSTLTRWSGDVMKRPGHKYFIAVSHNRSRPEMLFLNLTWRSRGQISSVLLQLLLFAFSNRKFGRHGKWSVTFWHWENNT